jgi:diguanylate cyclase (GGDEF)-like protein
VKDAAAAARLPLYAAVALGALLCSLSVTLVTPLSLGLVVAAGWLAAFALWAAFFERRQRDGGLSRSGLELDLRRQHEIFQAIEANVPAIVYRRIARPGGWEYPIVAGRTSEILGMPAHEAFTSVGLSPRLFLLDSDHERIAASYTEKIAAGGGAWSGEFRISTPRGDVKWIRAAIQIEAEGGREKSATGLLLDVTEEKLASERVQHALDRDGLTALYSRDYFERAVALALERYAADRRLFAVIKFQIDDFQEISDALGIGPGDYLLCLVGDAALAAAPEAEVVARLAAEKFAVLADVADVDAAAELAGRIVQSVGRRYSVGTNEIEIAVSVGCALPASFDTRATDLMHDSGSALERSRADGGGMFRLYEDEMTLESVKRVTIREALRDALERDEFRLVYQPKIELTTGRVTGCEALLRWRDPAFGVRPPAQFIPIAERSGLIVPIGDWVFREVCRQYVAWQAAGVAGVPIAVNVSAAQFARSDVYTALAAAMEEAGAPPGSIDIEITESLLVDCSDQLIGELTRIRGLGSEIALDDFGTGFSSMAYLKRLPLSLLKIDQNLASSALNSSVDAAIVRSIVYLAEELDLRVVAEGAETAEQVAYLRSAGCREIQGFYFSRPLAAAKFAAYVTAHGAVAPRELRAVRPRPKRSVEAAAHP